MNRTSLTSSPAFTRLLVTRMTALILCIALFAPVSAHAGILDIFSSIESTISKTIGQALQDIRTIQTQVQTLYKEVLWPLAAIEQAQSFVTRTIQSYRSWMSSVFSMPIASAQLSAPRQFESTFLSGNAMSFPQMGTGYTSTYGALPTAQQAKATSLQIMDINDALAKDALSQSMASDQANHQMLTIADQMESGVSTAAPGSSSYVTASALMATLQTQSFQLKLMASLLREESVQIAHQNARMKQQITEQNTVNQNLQQMLTVQP